MLHEGGTAPVAGVVSLDSLHLGGDKFTHKVRILAEALLRTAPARVAGQIGVRSPENEGLMGIVLGIEAGLMRHDVTHEESHFAVPGLADAVGLRERGAVCIFRRCPPGPAAAELAGVTQAGKVCVSPAHDAVDGLRRAGIADTEPRHPHTHERADFLLRRHQGDGVIQPLLLRERRVPERILLSLEHGGKRHAQYKSTDEAFHLPYLKSFCAKVLRYRRQLDQTWPPSETKYSCWRPCSSSFRCMSSAPWNRKSVLPQARK